MNEEFKGRGLFVFSDPGGAKPILSLIKLKKLKNYKVFSDRNYSFYRDFGINVQRCTLHEVDKILETNKPDYVYTGTSYTSLIEKEFLFKAKKKKITTCSFIDHYTRYNERFLFKGDYVYPDKVFLTDEKAKHLADLSNISSYSKVFVSGNYYHDYLKKWKPIESKENTFPNLKPKQKIILFAPDPLSNIKKEKIFSFDEVDVWKHLSEAINKYLEDINIMLLVKLHPNQNRDYLKKGIDQKPTKNFKISVKSDNNHIIYYSDLVIGMYSSLLIEASFFKKKILRHIPNPINDDPIKDLNIGTISSKVSDLSKNIRSSL